MWWSLILGLLMLLLVVKQLHGLSSLSAFDGKAVDAGTVSLSGGFNAVWNLNASRWEYREVRTGEGNFTLQVTSVVWSAYGLTAFSSQGSNEITISWSAINSPSPTTPVTPDSRPIVLYLFSGFMGLIFLFILIMYFRQRYEI